MLSLDYDQFRFAANIAKLCLLNAKAFARTLINKQQSRSGSVKKPCAKEIEGCAGAMRASVGEPQVAERPESTPLHSSLASLAEGVHSVFHKGQQAASASASRRVSAHLSLKCAPPPRLLSSPSSCPRVVARAAAARSAARRAPRAEQSRAQPAHWRRRTRDTPLSPLILLFLFLDVFTPQRLSSTAQIVFASAFASASVPRASLSLALAHAGSIVLPVHYSRLQRRRRRRQRTRALRSHVGAALPPPELRGAAREAHSALAALLLTRHSSQQCARDLSCGAPTPTLVCSPLRSPVSLRTRRESLEKDEDAQRIVCERERKRLRLCRRPSRMG